MICGAYGRGNAGDDAILLAILTELRSIDPDLSFQVFSRSPMDTRRTYRVNAFYTFNGFQAIRYFRKAKFFINGGGSSMQDVTSNRSLWFYLWTLAAAKKHHCPVIMYGCGIGPIQKDGNRRRAAKVMNKYVDSITLRDPDSRKELEVLGVTKPAIALSADTTVSSPRRIAGGHRRHPEQPRHPRRREVCRLHPAPLARLRGPRPGSGRRRGLCL
ncbi:MAG: polysaccharide pyruvyl transferase family protein [Evtepia sp.]